jgi:transcriptional repressor NrdR
MRCPYCHDNNDKVIDSREAEGGKAVRRRRQCQACGKRFTTYESIRENTRLLVVKRDNTRVPFERQKLLTGLERACYKRPVPAERIAALVDDVEDSLLRRGEREVASIDIGRLVAEQLKRIDHVAYLRFASVYLDFHNVDDVIDEAMQIKTAHPPEPPPEQGKLF